MERSKDLSGLYLLLGALLGFFIALAFDLVFIQPPIEAHYGPVARWSKPPVDQTYTEAKVGVATACIGATMGMLAGSKVYSIRQRRREAIRS